MKKLLLSSIIMFGICGFVTAQNATDSKLRQASTKPTATSAVTATPQKAASATNENAVVMNADGTPAPANAVAPTTKRVRTTDAKVSQTDADLAKKKEIEEAKATAPADKKGN